MYILLINIQVDIGKQHLAKASLVQREEWTSFMPGGCISILNLWQIEQLLTELNTLYLIII